MAQSEIRIPPEAIAALRQGRTIEAIKLLRAATGLSLKDAKDAVEAQIGHIYASRRGQADERAPEPTGIVFFFDKPGRSDGDSVDLRRRLGDDPLDHACQLRKDGFVGLHAREFQFRALPAAFQADFDAALSTVNGQ